MKKIIWFSIHIIAIIYFSYLHATIHKDAAIPFIYLMFLLSFPLGFIVPFIFIALLSHIHIAHDYLFLTDIVLIGILCMIVGYIQWFILIPKIKKYLKKKKLFTPTPNK